MSDLVGKTMRYTPATGSDATLLDRAGMRVLVLRLVKGSGFIFGGGWVVRFEDGHEDIAFGDELTD